MKPDRLLMKEASLQPRCSTHQSCQINSPLPCHTSQESGRWDGVGEGGRSCSRRPQCAGEVLASFVCGIWLMEKSPLNKFLQ